MYFILSTPCTEMLLLHTTVNWVQPLSSLNSLLFINHDKKNYIEKI